MKTSNSSKIFQTYVPELVTESSVRVQHVATNLFDLRFITSFRKCMVNQRERETETRDDH